MKNNKTKKSGTNRRKFLKLGLLSSVTAIAGTSIVSNLTPEEEKNSGEKRVKEGSWSKKRSCRG